MEMFKQPEMIPVNDNEYYLINDYEYEWSDEINGQLMKVTVEKGFTCNLASVPRFVWTLTGFLPDGLHRGAALIHDYLYRHRGMPQAINPTALQVYTNNGWRVYVKRLTRRQIDKVFLKAMEEAGTGGFKRHLMYWAVRSFGGAYW